MLPARAVVGTDKRLMETPIQERLVAAIVPCLRLVARLMLRSGIGYRRFDEIARTAFVREALGERDPKGRTTNLSRVAVRTGLSRKEVSRLKSQIDAFEDMAPKSSEGNYDSGHIARVLQLWHADSRFTGDNGGPMALEFSGEGPTFQMLVKAAGGDFPPGAVRAELAAAGAIVESEDGLLRATKRHFIPSDVGEELLVGVNHFVLPVLIGLARNTKESREQQFFQRLAYSDLLPENALTAFRTFGRDAASDFVQLVDDWLSANESTADASDTVDRTRAGIGVFYFESPVHSWGTEFQPDVDRESKS